MMLRASPDRIPPPGGGSLATVARSPGGLGHDLHDGNSTVTIVGLQAHQTLGYRGKNHLFADFSGLSWDLPTLLYPASLGSTHTLLCYDTVDEPRSTLLHSTLT